MPYSSGGGFTGGTITGPVTFNSNASFPDGAIATPSINFTSGTTTGISKSGTNLDFSASGTGIIRMQTAGVGIPTGSIYYFTSGTTANAADTSIAKSAAAVISAQNGAGGAGWFRNTAGEDALNANYTNATAGFTATNLSSTVISGRTYSFEAVLFFSDSTAADGAQFDFNGGSAAATNFIAQAFAYNNVGGALTLTNGAITALATAIQVTLAVTTQTMLVVKGSFVPSGNGTFIIRGAQTAHTTGTLTLNRGSYLNIRDANPL